MLFLICPACGTPNALEATVCQLCQTSLENVLPEEEPTHSPQDEPFADPDQPNEDLPDLLHALKPDPDADTSEASLDAGHAEEWMDKLPEVPEEETPPDWLKTIRERAQVEEDSVGEMIRRIAAAQEAQEKETPGVQHDEFEAWMKKVRESSQDTDAEKQTDHADKPATEEPGETDWLTRVRRARGVPETRPEPDAAGRSLLDWLVALEEERSQASGSDGEITQQIQLEHARDGNDPTQRIKIDRTGIGAEPVKSGPTLTVSRTEQDQVDQLQATITDENLERIIPTREANRGIRWQKIAWTVLYVACLLVPLLGGLPFALPSGPLSTAGQAVAKWAESPPAGSDVALVIDYSPGFASEINAVAQPVLEKALPQMESIAIISSSLAGSLLGSDLLTAVEIHSSLPPVTDLGYVPHEMLGAYGLATWLSPNIMSPVSSHAQLDVVVILSDSAESAQVWVEQLSAREPALPIYLLVSARAKPLLQPYFDSGQVSGMIGGLSDASNVENAPHAGYLQAYRTGLIVLMGALVLGAAASIIAPPERNQELKP